MALKKGTKMRIVGSDIKVTSLSEGEFFGEATYLDRVETPGIIEVVSPEEGIFEFEGDHYQLLVSDFKPYLSERYFGLCFEPLFQSEGGSLLECQLEIDEQLSSL
tara:strand:+ start:794 stop:1108 length:315 start_codon:yes stop_codon:yes gene_type:complete